MGYPYSHFPPPWFRNKRLTAAERQARLEAIARRIRARRKRKEKADAA